MQVTLCRKEIGMLLKEKELFLPRSSDRKGLIRQLQELVGQEFTGSQIPVRIAITETSPEGYNLEIGILSDTIKNLDSIFKIRRRDYENQHQFNTMFLIPTGIGAELGGHSGDAGAAARLLASCSDNLITHPNVVNAADINELPENALYVEGSVISQLIMGSIGLQKVRSNRVLVVVDEHSEKMFHELAINSASAARASLGLECPLVIKMEDRVIMRARYSKSGRAGGTIEHFQRLCEALEEHKDEYDAIALTSLINVPDHYHKDYFAENSYLRVNPWGGVEAMLTHALSMLFKVPSAHSPMMTSKEIMELDVGITDPRKSAEAVSTTYLHCILKGLHRSPRIIPDARMHGDSNLLTAADISCLVIPDGCVGLPTLAAIEQGIPVIAVRENENCMRNNLEDYPFKNGKLFIVENYLEAVGVITALKAGIAVDTVRRPIGQTKVVTKKGTIVPKSPTLDR